MAVLDSIDTWDEGSAVYEGRLLRELTRTAHVTGIDPGSTGFYADALSAPGLPAYWSEHPDEPTLRCVSLQPELTGPREARVLCRYHTTRTFQVAASSDSVQIQTDYDRFQSRQITVKNPLTKQDQPGVITVPSPIAVVALAKLRSVRAVDKGVLPWNHCVQWQNTINLDNFLGATALYWFVTRVSATDAGMWGVACLYTYEFAGQIGVTGDNGVQYSAWQPQAAAFDPDHDEPAMGATFTNGGRRVIAWFAGRLFAELDLEPVYD